MYSRIIRLVRRRARRVLSLFDGPRRAPVVLRLGNRSVGTAVRGALYDWPRIRRGRAVRADGALVAGEADNLRVRVRDVVGEFFNIPLPTTVL